MAEARFIYDGQDIVIQCNKNQKMRDICTNLSTKINVGINSLIFLYGGTKLNMENTFKELTKENKITIIVYKYENEEICPKCGRILKNEIFDEIILSNNKMSYSLIGIKRQIELIISDINKNIDRNFINSQLQNINVVINNINENIKKMNDKLNLTKLNDNNIIKPNENKKSKENNNNIIKPNENNKSKENNNNIIKPNENNKNKEKNNNIIKPNENNKENNNNIIKPNENNKKAEKLKNEIICRYNKQKDEIDLLHDYTLNMKLLNYQVQKSYMEGKNNINEKNIDIYINDKKIKFNYKYKSNEKGNIKVKFILNKLLTSTTYMFYGCSSLQSIDLSSFNSTKINDMSCMFNGCSSLQSINLSSFNTTNVKYMDYMFHNCSSLKSINLSSFNTTNVNNMCCMFSGCSSLQSIDLSSFNTTNVEVMYSMFDRCSSLKRENVKIGSYGKKILE